MVIGPTPPGTGVIAAATSAHRAVGDVADQAVALRLRGVVHPVDADVDDHRARPHHVRRHELGLADRRDEDVGARG